MTSSEQSPSTGLIAAVPLALLLAIFGLQYVTAQTTVLTPWKGGGFGMFSTVDVDTGRIVKAYFDIDGQEYPVAVPEQLDGTIKSLRPMPTEERVEDFARRLAAIEWVEHTEYRPEQLQRFGPQVTPATERHWTLRSPLHDEEQVAQIQGVRVQVWGREFRADDDGGGTLSRVKLQDVYVATTD